MKRTRRKRQKKSISVLLLLAMLLSMFSLPVSAANVDIFDKNWYAAANPDVVQALGTSERALRDHYENFGKREGRSPSSLFDPTFYLNSYPDLKAAFGNNYVAAYDHFLAHGLYENRQGSPHYNISVYKQNYQDLRNAFGTDNSNNWKYLQHWLQHGQYEKRNALTAISASNSSPTAAASTQSSSSSMSDVTRSFVGKTIRLKSVENGKYLCANSNLTNTPATCNQSVGSTWETFSVTVTSDGWAGLKAHNGKYLCARKDITNAPLTATADKLQSWECYKIYQKDGTYYLKAQANNKYLCVRVDTANAPIQAYVDNASTWERFQIEVVNQTPATTTMCVLTSTGASLNVRAAANTSSAILGKLPYGSRVEVLSTSNGWARIQYNGRTGYVSAQYLSPIDVQSDSQFWQWPVDNQIISQAFGKYSEYMAREYGRPYHAGLDIVNAESRKGGNPPVKAAADGVVVYSGYSKGNGNHIVLQHSFNGSVVYSLYSHLANFEGCPGDNQKVSKGQKIGKMGNTGNSSGTHLHFAVFTGEISTDPVGYTTEDSDTRMTAGGRTFYNPALVLAKQSLP